MNDDMTANHPDNLDAWYDAINVLMAMDIISKVSNTTIDLSTVVHLRPGY